MFAYIKIFGKIIPMYGVCIVIGVALAAMHLVFDCKKRGLLWEDGVIISASGLGIGFLGAKLLYVFVTFTPSQLAEIIRLGKFKEILNGGFVFYGGLIFGIAGAWLGSVIAKRNLGDFENILVKEIPFVHAFGRMGCFFAGCCYGKPTNSPIYVVFKNPISDAPIGVNLVPVQIYEAVFNLMLFAVLELIDKKFSERKLLLPLYLLLYSVWRFFIEFFRYDYVRGVLLGVSTSQWISAAMFVIALILLKKRKNTVKNKVKVTEVL